jgi:hypothetical protein
MKTKTKLALVIILAGIFFSQAAANFINLSRGFVNAGPRDFPSRSHFYKHELRLFLSAIYNLVPFTGDKRCNLGPDAKRYGRWISNEDEFRKVLEKKNLDKRLGIVYFADRKIIKSPYRFDYLAFGSRRARIFVEKYGLKEMIKDKRDELEKIVALLHWAHTRWSPHYASRTDRHALKEILAYKEKSFSADKIVEIDASTTMMNCPAASFLLAQAMASLGYPARIISVADHMACEVWSDKFAKWIYTDPYYDVYFEKDRVPLSWLDLHILLKDINTLWGGGQVKSFADASSFYKKLNIDIKSLSFDGKNYQGPSDEDTFHYLANHVFGTVFAVNLRNDQLENIYPKFHVRYHKYIKLDVLWKQPDVDYRFVTNNEKWLSPKHTTSFIPPRFQLPLAWQATADIDGLYWNLNFTQIYVNPENITAGKKGAVLEVALATFTPNFDYFYSSIDNGPWIKCAGHFLWHLRSGENRIRVRSRNKYGHLGAISEIAITAVPN